MRKGDWIMMVLVIVGITAFLYFTIQLKIDDDNTKRKVFIQCTQKTKDVTWCYDSIK